MTDVAGSRLLEALANRPLVLDAATGLRLMALGLDLTRDDPALWNLDRPASVLDLHCRDASAGADVLTANTFGANRPTLERLGRSADLAAINRRAVQLAREAAGPDRFVLGSIGPGPIGVVPREADYSQQAAILLDAGADALLIETRSADRAIEALRQLEGDAVILVTLVGWADGEDWAGRLRSSGASAIGTNCAAIGAVLADLARLHRTSDLPLIARPCGSFPGGATATPEEFAAMTRSALALGARLIGGCCGADERHIAAIRGEFDR